VGLAVTKRDKSNATIWFSLIPAVVIVMRLASPATADFSYVALAGYALLGRGQAIQALFLAWLFTMLSEYVAPVTSFAAIGRYAVTLGAALSVLLRSGVMKGTLRINNLVMVTLLLGVLLVFHSLLFSLVADVSILKAINFTLVFSTLLAAWGGLLASERHRIERFIFGGLIVVLLVSLPLVAAGGYLVNDTGFHGILNHPQAFGPTIALLGAWLGGRFLSERHMPWWHMAILGACLVSIALSEARTAGAALVLGVAFPLIVIIIFKPHSVGSLLLGLRSKRMIFVGVITILGIVFAETMLIAGFEYYMTKSGRSETNGVLEAIKASRGVLVYPMFDNIERNPWTGIGFGVASVPSSMVVVRDPFLGLPISASIEKGVLPIAVMEELGIPGFVLVAAWFWMLIRRAASGGFVPFVVITTVLIINLGESIFFSPGGLGLLLMVLVGWAATSQQSEMGSAKRYD
jgi:hypothetical protein